jgi:hypothetical protein
MICDPGERYLGTDCDAGWIKDQRLDPRSHWLETFCAS